MGPDILKEYSKNPISHLWSDYISQTTQQTIWPYTFMRRAWQPTPVSCLENPHRQRSLVGYIQSMGSQRVGHGWATKHSTLYIHTPKIYFNYIAIFLSSSSILFHLHSRNNDQKKIVFNYVSVSLFSSFTYKQLTKVFFQILIKIFPPLAMLWYQL